MEFNKNIKYIIDLAKNYINTEIIKDKLYIIKLKYFQNLKYELYIWKNILNYKSFFKKSIFFEKLNKK